MFVVTTEPDAGQNRDGKNPQVPTDHERDEVVESQLGPLIKTAFERHQAIEKDHGRGERKVERDDARIQKTFCSWPNLRGPTYPERAHDEHNLSQHQIEKSKFFFEDSTARFNIPLDFSDTMARRSVLSVFIDCTGQPLDHIWSHFGNNFVRRVIALEHNGARARF